jgi:protease-4
MMMPPPFYPPPPPPSGRGGSFARGIFMTLATTIFGLSLAANVYLLLASGFLSSAGGSKQNVITEGDLTQKIAVVPISDIIDEASYKRFDKLMKQVESDSHIKALVLELDTPGGSVTASDEIYQRVMKYKEAKGVKVIAAMGATAASGGYYVACAADSIVAQRTTITGSIGVMIPRYNLAKLAEKWGIEDHSLHATGADWKLMGDSLLKPEPPEETPYLLNIIDQAFVIFKGVVVKGRGTRLKQPIDQIANGKIYTTAEAMSLGLVDQEGYSEDAYALAAQGLSKPHIVRYESSSSLLDLMGAESSKAPASAGVTINGVNLNVDRNLLNDLTTPRLMYLWRGQ